MHMITEESSALLGAADIRRIAASTGINPTKRFGQNFVVDPGTVRRIARLGDLGPDSRVIEVGPGLGSLTLALLETGAQVLAVEIDPRLADLLPSTVRAQMPQAMSRFHLIREDALQLGLDQVEEIFGSPLPQLTLMSNLPYNVATPIILTLLERFPSLASFTVMVLRSNWPGTARRNRQASSGPASSGQPPMWTPPWSLSPATTKGRAHEPICESELSPWWTPPSANAGRPFTPP